MLIRYAALSNSTFEYYKLYADRRNVERKLGTDFQISNLSSDIPAGELGTLLVKNKKNIEPYIKTNCAN